MAKKIEVLPLNYFSDRKAAAKEIVSLSKKVNWRKVGTMALTIAAGITFASQGLDISAMASPLALPPDAVAAIASVNPSTNFIGDLHRALSPLRDLVRGFGHEIYGVYMLWGAIEVMIDKAQQGFNRMKIATLGYVLLVWAPRIVEWITGSVG